MKFEFNYNNGKVDVKSTFTEEEKQYADTLKKAADQFYKTVESIVEAGKNLEGILDIKIKSK